MVGLISAAGLIGFLSDSDPEIQIFALKRLNEDIDHLWTEVAESLGGLEVLYEDPQFPQRSLAALVASKTYFHLQDYKGSMVFALYAGELFDPVQQGLYEDTILSECVTTWIAEHHPTPANDVTEESTEFKTSSSAELNGASSISASLASPTMPFSQATLPSKSLLSRQDSTSTDRATQKVGGIDAAGFSSSSVVQERSIQVALNNIMEELFERCFRAKRYKHVIGIAVEAHDLGVIKRAILRANSDDEDSKAKKDGNGQAKELLDYLLTICMDTVHARGLRQGLLRLILDLLRDLPSPDVFSITRCIVYLDEHEMAAKVLTDLVEKEGPKHLAEAYQIAFDLYDNSSQDFLKKVREALPKEQEEAQEEHSNTEKMEEDEAEDAKESDSLLKKEAEAPLTTKDKSEEQHQFSPEARKALASISEILEGSKTISLNLEFLYRNNHANMAILKKLKDSLEARNSIFHTAVTLSCGFMHAGTMNDSFFRDNLEWLGKAINWSKFTATAALGVIHRGNLSNGQTLLGPYLPKDPAVGTNTSSVYSQGGSLYALGLIYTNHQSVALELIRDHFKKATEEVIQHGGALGLGLAGMATWNTGIYEDLKEVLYSDSALNGEAVGIAMGLVMLGTGNIKFLREMIEYAHATQHEKIKRGLGLGMALIMYGQQEGADDLVNGLLEDSDHILRYGGVQTLALAFCGTGSNKAVRKLLRLAVSDVSDDVRRCAVMSLGFILFRTPKSVPRLVELLSESYNPHVRYGAAMALGISCAGTGLDEAIDLLEPMIKDPTDFVRQGALIALSMIMVQQNEAMNPKVGLTRKTLQKAIGDRHEDAMTKFGSAISLGIIDAGGRNCTISLQTQTGNLNMAGIVGMAVFTQYWYWFPLTHFLSLSFTPTSIVGLDQDLEIPSFKFHSATRPSLFDYPPEQEAKTEDAPEKVKTAVLSTTAQAKRRAQKKEKQQNRDSMDIDQTPTSAKPSDLGDKMDITTSASSGTTRGDNKAESGKDVDNKPEDEKKESDEKAEKGDGLKRKMEKEKVGYNLDNMSRVLPAQVKFITYPDSRYKPVKKPTGGVILLNDTKPSEPKTLMEMKRKPPVKAATTAPSSTAAAATATQERGESATPATGSGAAEAAGVLTAFDEGGEGDEDAEVPRAFDYHSDEEHGEEEEE